MGTFTCSRKVQQAYAALAVKYEEVKIAILKRYLDI